MKEQYEELDFDKSLESKKGRKKTKKVSKVKKMGSASESCTSQMKKNENVELWAEEKSFSPQGHVRFFFDFEMLEIFLLFF